MSDSAVLEEVQTEQPARKQREKVERAPFRKESDPKLTTVEVPVDFNPVIHKPLNAGDFASSSVYLRYKAIEARKKADKYDAEAEQLEKLGSAGADKNFKKVLDIQKRMLELAKNIDPAQLRNILGAQMADALLVAPAPAAQTESIVATSVL